MGLGLQVQVYLDPSHFSVFKSHLPCHLVLVALGKLFEI